MERVIGMVEKDSKKAKITWRQRFDMWWIRTTLPPPKKGPLAFKKTVQEAKRILIVTPIEGSFPSPEFQELVALFKTHGKEIHVLIPGDPPAEWRGDKEAIWTFLPLRKHTLCYYRKVQPFKDLLLKRFDLLIDLHRHPLILGPYLCRKGRIPLCLGFGDNGGDSSFYNFIFRGKDLAGLTAFLQGFFR